MNAPLTNVSAPVSKATPATFHTAAAPMNGQGISRSAPAAPLNVGSSYHDRAQAFIKSSHAMGNNVTREGSELISSRPGMGQPKAPMSALSKLEKGASNAVHAAETGAVKGVKMMGGMAGAFGKAITGRDDFTKQVSRQQKAGRFNN